MRKVLILLASFIALNTCSAFAAPVYTFVGSATNNSDPSVWENKTFDITSLVSGSLSASLSFDLRNDAPSSTYDPDATTSNILFGIDEATNYYVHFDYVRGADTAHWRNVSLIIDGLLYVDQYGSKNNHLGTEFAGTSWMGNWGRNNALGMTDYDATTYTLTAASVPEPATMLLFGTGLLGLAGFRRKKKA